MTLRVAIDVQHRGKPDRPADRGAVWRGVEEVDVTSSYGAALDHRLRQLGHTSLWLGCGGYAERWALADQAGAHVYLACHLDAGLGGRPGDRGTVLYDHRSPGGRALAGLVAEALSEALPWPVTAAPCGPDDDGQPRDEDYSEAFACIRGVRAVALVLEPGFLDGAAGDWASPARRADLCQRIGDAVAQAIDRWARP